MEQLNSHLKAEQKPVSWLNQNFRSGEIFVDNSFQRRSVWTTKNQVRLIETVLVDMPMPEIYLWTQLPDLTTGKAGYSIVDGQQRITAISEFIAGDFKLEKKHLDVANRQEQFADCFFDELADEHKRQLWEYTLTTRVVPSHVQYDEIVKMFLRLNETDKSLNPQELRNAEFNGEFIKAAARICEFEFWKKHDFFKINDLRRMKDMQFVSSLLIFLRMGIEAEVNQRTINDTYDLYNDVYKEANRDSKIIQNLLNTINPLLDDAVTANFFRNPVHFYSLFVSLFSAQARSNDLDLDVREKLSKFVRAYEAKRKPKIVSEYRKAATEGTQKRSNRITRVEKLTQWLGW